MNSRDNRIIRVSPATVIIFSVAFSPLLFVGLLCIFKTGQPWTAVFLCALYAAAIYAICSPTVFLTDTTLRYRNLLKSRSVDLSTVIKASVTARPAPTLELRSTSSRDPFTFIIKPFSKKGVTCIMQHIRAMSPRAHFDKISEDLSHADFASVTREAISIQNLIRIALTVGGASLAAALLRALYHH